MLLKLVFCVFAILVKSSIEMHYRCSVQPCLIAILKFKPHCRDIISTQKLTALRWFCVFIPAANRGSFVTFPHTTALPRGESSVPLDASCCYKDKSVNLKIILPAHFMCSLLFPDCILSTQQHHGLSAVLCHLLQVSVVPSSTNKFLGKKIKNRIRTRAGVCCL